MNNKEENHQNNPNQSNEIQNNQNQNKIPNYIISIILKFSLDSLIYNESGFLKFYLNCKLVCKLWKSIVKKLVRSNNYPIKDHKDYFYSFLSIQELCKQLFNNNLSTGYHYVVKENNIFMNFLKYLFEPFYEISSPDVLESDRFIKIDNKSYGYIYSPNKSIYKLNLKDKEVEIKFFETIIKQEKQNFKFEFFKFFLANENEFSLELNHIGDDTVFGFAIFQIGSNKDIKLVFNKDEEGEKKKENIKLSKKDVIYCYGSCQVQVDRFKSIAIYKLKSNDNYQLLKNQLTSYKDQNGRFNCGSNNALSLYENKRPIFDILFNKERGYKDFNKEYSLVLNENRKFILNRDISISLINKIRNLIETLNVNVGFITRDFYRSDVSYNDLSGYDLELFNLLNLNFKDKVVLKSLIMNEVLNYNGFTYKVEEVSFKTINRGIQNFKKPHTLLFNTINDIGVNMFTGYYYPKNNDILAKECVVSLNSIIVLNSNSNSNNHNYIKHDNIINHKINNENQINNIITTINNMGNYSNNNKRKLYNNRYRNNKTININKKKKNKKKIENNKVNNIGNGIIISIITLIILIFLV